MNLRKLLKDFSIAVFAQALSALASIIFTLALPKVLGVTEFGYWQLFIFYAGYVGLCHLGINDGVYLIHGGKNRASIPKDEVNSQFLASTCFQLAISVIMFIVVAMLPLGEERTFVLSATALLITINNASLFIGYVFQAINETKLFSWSVVVESLILIIVIGALVLAKVDSFEIYVVIYLVAKLARLVFCVVLFRDFLKTKPLGPQRTLRLCLASLARGIQLMLANIIGALVLGLARFVIDAEFGIEEFSVVSLSLSIISFFLLFVSQVSMVLFPALRQVSEDQTSKIYASIREAASILFPLFYVLYYPIALLLSLWLPEYSQSMVFLGILFPMCVYEGKMDILGTTYLKVLDKPTAILVINVLTLAVSACITFTGIYLLGSLSITLAGIAILFGVRELFTERFIESRLHAPSSMTSLISLCLGIAFIVLNAACTEFIAFGIITAACLAFAILYRKRLATCLADVKG